YRLAPEHPFPAPVDDAFAAFRDVVARAAELGADPARVGVGGDSAGGHLAIAASLRAVADGGAVPAAQLLIYPVTDTAEDHPSRTTFADGYFLTKAHMDFFQDCLIPDGADARDPLLSPLYAPSLDGLPPAIVITSGFDVLRDEGEAFAGRLRDAGV